MLRALPSFARPKRSSTPPRSPDVSHTSSTEARSIPNPSADVSPYVAVTPSEVHPVPSQPSLPRPRPGAGKIADRVRSINDLQASSSHSPVRRSDDLSSLHRKVSATTAGRALPFVRRDASATPLSPDTSHLAGSVSYIHSPTPKRFQPQLSQRIEVGASVTAPRTVDTSYTNQVNKTKDVSPALMRRRSSGFINPVPIADPARDLVMCPRHGRTLAPRRKIITTTTDGLEKSSSGTYVPKCHTLLH